MRRTLTTGLSIGAMVALSLSTLTHAAPAAAAAFVEAAMNGNREAVRALLKDGADVNTTRGSRTIGSGRSGADQLIVSV